MPTINKYTYDEVPIGEGGMGCVYRATNASGKIVALKMLKTQYASMPAFNTFFRTEAAAIRHLTHPNVVGIEGEPFSDSAGNLYLPMQFVEGQTIEKRVKTLLVSGERMEESEATNIMLKILNAFEYIHSQGVIHRDIKPSNIMLRPDGSICIIDFGIARDSRLPTGYTIGHCVGTDGYMSPEQVNGLNIDHRTDIYSLGCLLFYMMTGTHAIKKKDNDHDTRVAILNDTIPSPRSFRPDISEKMEKIILKSTDKDMRVRYRSANAFRLALEQNNAENSTFVQGVDITVGRNIDNDVVIPNDYVSGSHLVISYNFICGKSHISIRDLSTNGTGIEFPDSMMFLKHNAYTMPFDIETQTSEALPGVLLSGREECMLNWNDVISEFKSRLNLNNKPAQKSDSEIKPKPKPKPNPRPQSTLWLIVLIFVLLAVLFTIMFMN